MCDGVRAASLSVQVAHACAGSRCSVAAPILLQSLALQLLLVWLFSLAHCHGFGWDANPASPERCWVPMPPGRASRVCRVLVKPASVCQHPLSVGCGCGRPGAAGRRGSGALLDGGAAWPSGWSQAAAGEHWRARREELPHRMTPWLAGAVGVANGIPTPGTGHPLGHVPPAAPCPHSRHPPFAKVRQLKVLQTSRCPNLLTAGLAAQLSPGSLPRHC